MPILEQLVASDDLPVCCAAVARFYGEPLRWALGLTLPQLALWQRLVPAVRAYDPLASAVWLCKPPKRPEGVTYVG